MNYYTEHLMMLAAKSNGKLTPEAIDEKITQAAACIGSDKFTVLNTLELAWEAYNEAVQFSDSIFRLHTLAGHSQEQIGKISRSLLDMTK